MLHVAFQNCRISKSGNEEEGTRALKATKAQQLLQKAKTSKTKKSGSSPVKVCQ